MLDDWLTCGSISLCSCICRVGRLVESSFSLFSPLTKYTCEYELGYEQKKKKRIHISFCDINLPRLDDDDDDSVWSPLLSTVLAIRLVSSEFLIAWPLANLFSVLNESSAGLVSSPG